MGNKAQIDYLIMINGWDVIYGTLEVKTWISNHIPYKTFDVIICLRHNQS